MSNSLIPHLFKTEYAKIIAVLCKQFGLNNIEEAEDIVSDTFLKAAETWEEKGVPENPKAWLYVVAKNKVKDSFTRKTTYRTKVKPTLDSEKKYSDAVELDLSDSNILDSQLKMMFAICNPINSKEAQIALALRILCGFGIDEISAALLISKSTINKKLTRAKVKLRELNIELVFPSENELEFRISEVLSILYLLFNEGYYSSHSEEKIKNELCYEAMQLLFSLLRTQKLNTPKANALMALFCFQASRFETRTDGNGNQVQLENQDRKGWNWELINKGEGFLQKSSTSEVSKFHLEALIAFSHIRIFENEIEKWKTILQFYNRLLQLNYSPMAALNRTYALAKVKGNKIAIKEALKIELKENHLYHALLAELYEGIDEKKRIKHLLLGLGLSKNKVDKRFFNQKLL